MGDEEAPETRRTHIGGKYGSPTVMVALPFARITNTDTELRDAVADLATLVSRLAAAAGDGAAVEEVRAAADELAARLS